MLGTGAVQAIHADRVAFAQTSGYRFLKGQTPGFPIWEFTTKSGRSGRSQLHASPAALVCQANNC
jgi:hypothetical protein